MNRFFLLILSLFILGCDSGGNDTCPTYDQDCAGECYGDAEIDECGGCDGSGFNEYGCCGDETLNADGCCGDLEPNCLGQCGGAEIPLDCAGVCGGTATEDCNGDCNGTVGIAEGACNCEGDLPNEDDQCTCDGLLGFPGYNCDNECMLPLDCWNACGGLAVIDECGNCGGLGAIYECGCNPLPQGACNCSGENVSSGCELPNNTLSLVDGYVFYNSDTEIAGFQFDVVGADLISASGGAAEDAEFTVSNSSSTILGFSFEANSITQGCGTLTILEFENSSSLIELDEIVISSPTGGNLGSINFSYCSGQ